MNERHTHKLKVRINTDEGAAEIVRWVLTHIEMYRNVLFYEVEDYDYSIGFDDNDEIHLSKTFYQNLYLNIYNHEAYFSDELSIKAESNAIDYISTLFYLINCVQEYMASGDQLDNLGRFRFEKSIQYKFGIIEDNYVIQLIDEFLLSLGIQGERRPSQIHFSHDIDFLTSGYRQESLYALRQGAIKKWWQLTKNLVNNRPGPWHNLREVYAIDKEYGIKGDFFFIPHMHPDDADYDIMDPSIIADIEFLMQEGMGVGLHKSRSNMSFRKELKELPFKTNKNRYHYLKFRLPQAWSDMTQFGVRADYSLGYPRQKGFRNSFGLPFTPFDLFNNRPYLLEVQPLVIMDVALASYHSRNRHAIVKEVMEFVDRHPYDAHISILWHNNSLTSYSNKYLKDAYTDLCDILKDR